MKRTVRYYLHLKNHPYGPTYRAVKQMHLTLINRKE